ncbi:MAG: 30S ribosomal protein S3 [Bacilli bacterium]|nr:30S ribosomal protein S3 [Bacilli bacterium]
MGQKVDPRGLRLGMSKNWESNWFAEKQDYVKKLNSDIKIREFLSKRLKDALVSEINIERKADRVDVKIFTARPGVIIGHGGDDIEKLRKEIKKVSGEDVYLTISEVKNPNLSAEIVAQTIAHQIENRGNFRKIQKNAIRQTMKAGAKGIKTKVSGRLNGAEMARSEGYTEGTVPLHTIRANIDYAEAEADTTYGKIGVKVWIYKGEVLKGKNTENKIKVERKGGNRDVNAKKN